jgi:hypothetical protein
MPTPTWGIIRKISEALESATAFRDVEEAPLEFLIATRWLLDAGLYVFGFAVAVFTILNAVYFGKTFGSGTDYIKLMFFTGATHATVVASVAAALNRFTARQ